MMKLSNLLKLSSLALMICATAHIQAADVDLATAQNVARSFMNKQVASGRLKATAATNLKLVKAEASVAKPAAVDYYIFNSDRSYVVIAGDDQAPEILMYGEEGTIDMNNIPPAMQWLLNKYKYQIDGIKAGTLVPTKAPKTATVAVAPLVTANWDQTAPYYNHTPTSGSKHAYTGCPATSLSMCFYKYKWPATYPALPAIPANSQYGYLAAPALEAKAADWDNIIDEYTGPTNYSYTTAQAEAVSWLMRYVGQACTMGYSTSGSGANDPEILEACHTFGYTDAQLLTLTELVQSGWSYTNGPQQYTDAQWNEWMLAELHAGRPIEYLAYDITSGQVSGHAFNVFGCNTSGQYYVNWGWSGDSNGYCTLHNFTTSTGATGQSGSYTFKYGEAMIIGIEPPVTGPTITANPTSLTFSGVIGNTYTKTVTVTGANLEGNITVTKSGNAAYTIDKTSITRGSDGSASATVTVTYKPTATGNTTATLTLKSSNADNVTVNISGTATAPTITATPSSVSFSCETGETKTQVVTIKGSNLTGNVAATLSGGNGYYTIDKSAISAATANSTNGGTITITYKPTAAGNTNATLTLKSANAADVVVNISGSASVPVPTITTSATSIAFGSNYTNVASTKTFTVTGRNLTEAIQATLTDANGVYTLSSTSISATEAANGKTITVTFNPKAAQTYNGTIKLTTAGANQVTINLSGTGQLLKVVPVMQSADENYIKHTSFRADWTDETPAANVASYTLEVSTKSAQPEPVSGGVADFSDIEAVVNDEGSLPNCASTASNYLPDGWTAENYLYINDGFVITGASSSWYSTTYGAVVSPTLDLTGNDKVTVVAKVKSYYPSYYGQATVRLLTGSAYKDFTLGSSDDDDFQTITAVLDCSSTDQVKVQARANYFALQDVKIYAGDITDTSANAPRRAAVEQGDSTMRTITGITDKFYTVKDLTGGGMFNFKVKAIYTDNTESQWSNIELVTLSQTPDTSWLMGDVNLDGKVDVQDVNILVNILLGTDQASNYDGRADVDGNGKVDVADINTVINIMLGNKDTNIQAKHTKFYLLDLSTEQK